MSSPAEEQPAKPMDFVEFLLSIPKLDHETIEFINHRDRRSPREIDFDDFDLDDEA